MKENWIEIELGRVLKTTSGGTPSRRKPEYYDGKIPWVKSGELNYNLILDTEEHISEEAVKKSSAKLFPKGTLLIALYGATIGKLAFLGTDATTNQAVCGIYKSKILETKFLYYYLFHNRRKLIEKGTGGAQPNISQTILKQLPLVVTNLPIQRGIVAKIEQLFSELDNGIQNLQQAKEKLAVFRQAVLKKAFEGELTNNKNIEWVTINDICEKVEYGTSNKSLTEGDIPVLRMGNIQNGRFDWEDLKYTDNQEEVEKFLLKKNDVLFNRTNSPEHVGKTAIFKEDRTAIFAGYLIRIDYYKDKISGEYLNYFLNSHTAKKYGNKVKSFGVNQSNINGTKLKTYPFPKTSLEEQHQIVQEIESRLSVCDEMEKSIESSLKKAEALRQSILKKAFEGELLTEKEIDHCKQEPDWETAEELLERIEKESKKTKN